MQIHPICGTMLTTIHCSIYCNFNTKNLSQRILPEHCVDMLSVKVVKTPAEIFTWNWL